MDCQPDRLADGRGDAVHGAHQPRLRTAGRERGYTCYSAAQGKTFEGLVEGDGDQQNDEGGAGGDGKGHSDEDGVEEDAGFEHETLQHSALFVCGVLSSWRGVGVRGRRVCKGNFAVAAR